MHEFMHAIDKPGWWRAGAAGVSWAHCLAHSYSCKHFSRVSTPHQIFVCLNINLHVDGISSYCRHGMIQIPFLFLIFIVKHTVADILLAIACLVMGIKEYWQHQCWTWQCKVLRRACCVMNWPRSEVSRPSDSKDRGIPSVIFKMLGFSWSKKGN